MPISKPTVTISIIPAQQLAGVQEQKVLIVGQKLAGGSATAGELIQELENNDATNNTLFGRRSHLAGMVRRYKKLNEVSQLDVIPLDDAGGATQGTGVLTFSGTATEAGSFFVTVGSKADHRYEIDVAVGDTATDIGDAVVAAFDLDLDAPFTQVNALGAVTFTAENGGSLSNDWGIQVEGTVAGVTYAITAWSGGATDPSLTTVLDVIENIRYQTIVWPSAYDFQTVLTELDSRFNSANNILDGVAIQVISDTLANSKTYVSGFNSQSGVVDSQRPVDEADRKGPATMEMLDIVAAEIAAARALRLTEDAQLTQILTTVAVKDQFGGIQAASLPYFNTSLPYTEPAKASDDFTEVELNELEDNGVAAYGPNRAFNTTILGAQVTTYLTDNAGNPDESYKYLNTVDTASVVREFYWANCKRRYAQTRLTEGDLIPGLDMANEASIRAFFNELYDELADNALVEKGTEAKRDFNDNLVIEVETSTGTVNYTMAPLLVGQLRVILGVQQIKFAS